MIGQTISHYRVLQRLGAGGMGTVFLRRHRLHRKERLGTSAGRKRRVVYDTGHNLPRTRL